MKKQITLIIVLLINTLLHAQQNVGIGTNTPNASALLEIRAVDKGLLIPRVGLTDAADVTTILSPVRALLVYNNSTSGSGALAVSPGFYFWNSASLKWTAITAADNSINSAWILGGNLGTSINNNYIGTADSQALVLKVNGRNSGFLGLTGNTFLGYYSGNINSLGYNNVAIGNHALFQNVNQPNLVAVGDSALLNNGLGAITSREAINNTAVGSKTLLSNTVGSDNTALGYNAMITNTNGTENTATGSNALYFNSTGFMNTANGSSTLKLNTTGTRNVATGSNSLSGNTNGSNNTANGVDALFSNTSGYSNVAVGVGALRSNTDQSNLVAIGDSALYNNGSGSGNTAVGTKTLFANTTGNDNTAIGNTSLKNNTTGQGNTATGILAIGANSTGNYNTA